MVAPERPFDARRAAIQSDRSMTAKEALDTANDAALGERLRRYETSCAPRGSYRREPLSNDPGRWTWCPDCLTVYDDYAKAVNQIPELVKTRGSGRRLFA
jgi:hypothetical protein